MILQNINEKSMGVIRKYREKIEKKHTEREEAQKKAHFLTLLKQAKNDVILKRNHFENATEDKLLDCCILELTAAESRLNYYLSLARKENLTNDEYMDAMLFVRQHEGSNSL